MRSPPTRGVARTEAGKEDQDHDQDGRHWKVFSFAERFHLPGAAFSSCSCVSMMMNADSFVIKREKFWAAICLRISRRPAIS
jgi:hypothetical protein